ncbi:MAG: DUF2339 domain-containing protein, partial [Chryseobacterium sp.]|nr:DUF2339 domain-containing protein [Chryseobacterium sp.]
MEYILIVVLIVLIIWVYQKLNRKIQILEQKISDLSKSKVNIGKPEQPFIEGINSEISPNDKIDVEKAVISTAEESPEEKKDWLNPLFDFIKQNVLTIIGIFTLVLGIGYFVKYAI